MSPRFALARTVCLNRFSSDQGEVVDTAFMLPMRESNRLTAWWVRQARCGALRGTEASIASARRVSKSELTRFHNGTIMVPPTWSHPCPPR